MADDFLCWLRSYVFTLQMVGLTTFCGVKCFVAVAVFVLQGNYLLHDNRFRWLPVDTVRLMTKPPPLLLLLLLPPQGIYLLHDKATLLPADCHTVSR
jgi:hypothetical protein